MKIAVITTAVCMVGGIPTAYFISRCDKKWRGLLLAASIFPMMTNSVIRSFAWINILAVSYTHLDVYKRQDQYVIYRYQMYNN